jgi:adenosine 3'-phospho 5'-phosphosulfate transporter B3
VLVLGLVIFMVADANKSPDFNPIGVALILTSLVVDAAISNLQEYIFTTYNTDEEELVFTSYAGGSLVLFLLCMATGDMTDGLNYLHHHEGYSLFSSTSVIVVFAACGFCGVSCVAALTPSWQLSQQPLGKPSRSYSPSCSFRSLSCLGTSSASCSSPRAFS